MRHSKSLYLGTDKIDKTSFRIIMDHPLDTNPDLNLAPELKATLPGAKANLTLLMYLTSPAAKLDALDRLISLPSLQSKTPISSDELLPWLIQALINCQIFNLYSQLDYMSRFNLSEEETVINILFLQHGHGKYF